MDKLRLILEDMVENAELWPMDAELIWNSVKTEHTDLTTTIALLHHKIKELEQELKELKTQDPEKTKSVLRKRNNDAIILNWRLKK